MAVKQNMNTGKNKVLNTAKKAAYNPLIEALTRVGYAVRGLIYLTMGLLSIQVALGKGGSTTGQQGAIAAIGNQPAGRVLLWIVLVGLVAYALWGVIRAVLNPLHKSNDLKGWLARGGYLVSAVGYAALVPTTYGYIRGSRSAASGGQNQGLVVSVMSMPWGRFLVGAVGLAVVVAGLYQVYLGFTAGFDKQFKTYSLSPETRKLIIDLGRFGTSARGVVLAIIGLLVTAAAYKSIPNQAIGTDTALATLLRQPYGIWLLGIIALGLVAFGIFSILNALWFRMPR